MNKFMTKYGGWILALLSSAGVAATAALAGDEIPKAKEAIREAEKDRERELTTGEKIKIAAPICLPAVLTGGLTVGGIVGNQALHHYQGNALLVAGTAIAEYDRYRKAIRAEQGDAVDRRAYERAKMREDALMKEIARLKEENGPYLYGIRTIPGLIFEARPGDIQESFMHFNRNLCIAGRNNFTELYAFIGIPEKFWDKEETDRYGWDEYFNSVNWDSYYLDFDIRKIETQNGTVVRMIDFPIPPYDLSVDYDNNPSLDGLVYPRLDDQAEMYIKNQYQIYGDMIVEIDHPDIIRTGII